MWFIYDFNCSGSDKVCVYLVLDVEVLSFMGVLDFVEVMDIGLIMYICIGDVDRIVSGM